MHASPHQAAAAADVHAAGSPRRIFEGVASGESSSVPLRLLGVVWLEAPPEGGLGGIWLPSWLPCIYKYIYIYVSSCQ